MAPVQSYSGPAALAFSKYASPQHRQTALGFIPAAVSSPAATTGDNTIATKEQIAAANGSHALDAAPQNADVELAFACGNILKEEVDKHVAKFSKTVSLAVTTTRRLLELIRESLQKDNAADLTTVDGLWAELERVFAAANAANAAVPVFLEKQRNNMSLYHASMMNEAMHDSQVELNIQHKKVNIQHNIILEHHEAFEDYKAYTAVKLKEFDDLQERLSRLTLEKGNYRTEVEKFKQMLEEARTASVKDLHSADALQKQIQTLESSKKELIAENEVLRSTIRDVQDQKAAAEQQITDRFTLELKSKTHELAKETQKTTGLNAMIRTLRGSEDTKKMETNKLKHENKTIKDKYTEQATEHAQAFTKLSEQTKKIEALSSDLVSLQKENVTLKERITKLSELEGQTSQLKQEKIGLLAQVVQLTAEYGMAKSESQKAGTQVDGLIHKIGKLDKEIEGLETENNDLLMKQGETKKDTQALQILKSENSKLNDTIKGLRAGGAALAVSGSSTSVGENEALESKMRGLEASLQEWTDLAKRSYQKYKEMIPVYNEAEKYRMDALEKDDEIKTLKEELSDAKNAQSNGVGASGDTAYWKNKYESLLATVGE